MILIESVRAWHYNSESGLVVGYRPRPKGTKDSEVRFHLTDQTKLGKDVINKWWDKPPLAIIFDNTKRSPVQTGK